MGLENIPPDLELNLGRHITQAPRSPCMWGSARGLDGQDGGEKCVGTRGGSRMARCPLQGTVRCCHCTWGLVLMGLALLCGLLPILCVLLPLSVSSCLPSVSSCPSLCPPAYPLCPPASVSSCRPGTPLPVQSKVDRDGHPTPRKDFFTLREAWSWHSSLLPVSLSPYPTLHCTAPHHRHLRHDRTLSASRGDLTRGTPRAPCPLPHIRCPAPRALCPTPRAPFHWAGAGQHGGELRHDHWGGDGPPVHPGAPLIHRVAQISVCTCCRPCCGCT